MGIRLEEPLHKVLGDRTAKVLRIGLHLETVGDLLRHYPRRHVRRGQLTELANLEVGTDATVPIPPGLVSVNDAPCRSSAASLLSRALSTRS